MDSSNLSSNWKKLQQTLKAQPPTIRQSKPHTSSTEQTKSPKRKLQTQTVTANAANTGVKRQKLDSSHHSAKAIGINKKERFVRSEPRRTKMGGYLSTPTQARHDGDTEDDIVKPIANKFERRAQVPVEAKAQAGKYIAVDCEMVGTTSTTIFSVKSSNNNDFSILARVSIVSYAQEILYDTYVLPPTGVQITDYRTKYSGITPWHLNPDNPVTTPRPFEHVQKDVAELFQGRILVGHAINNDLAVLGLSHPKRSVRDTSSYPKYRALAAAVRRDGTPGKGRKPALKMLTTNVLGYDIQNDDTKGHDSVEDARATMALFQREKKGFEEEAVKRFGRSALSVGIARTPIPDKKVSAGNIEDHDASEGDDSIDEDLDEEDEAADEAEIENAEDINTEKRSTKAEKSKPKKKKKKGKYRK